MDIMNIISVLVFILVPVGGVYTFLGGAFAIKRQRIKVGNWGNRVLYQGLPAIILGITMVGLGVVMLISFFTSLYWTQNPFELIWSAYHPIIIYSLICSLPLAIIARVILARQHKHKP